MKLSTALYKAARTSRDVHAVTTGRVVTRAKNHAVGRALSRTGFWSRLWR